MNENTYIPFYKIPCALRVSFPLSFESFYKKYSSCALRSTPPSFRRRRRRNHCMLEKLTKFIEDRGGFIENEAALLTKVAA